MKRIATLDIGTNTVLLLVAESDGSGFHVIADRHGIARLGEGVDRTGLISEAAYERFRTLLSTHAATIKELGVEHVAAVATSAMRDARNRGDIIRRAFEDTGIRIELLPGEDEAQWTYRGALAGMTCEGKVGVVDIGGGSTEIAMGDGRAYASGTSIDMGAVRVTERCFSTSPITTEATADALEIIRRSLSERVDASAKLDMLIAVAGTPTTLAAMHQGLPAFDHRKVQGYTLSRAAIEQLLSIMLSVDTATLLEHFPSVNQARADILPAGTLILAETMDYLHVSTIRVSTRGLRYGIAIREFEHEFGKMDVTTVSEG